MLPRVMARSVCATLLAVAASGCAELRTATVNLTSRDSYDPSERPVVWGRALTAMQIKGLIISKSDAVGGLLRSEVQPRAMTCGNNVYTVQAKKYRTEYQGTVSSRVIEEFDERERANPCSVWTMSQLTVTPDGTVFLSTRMSFTAETFESSPITDEEHASLQRENDAMVSFIVGKSKKAPEPLPPAPKDMGRPPKEAWGSQDI